MYEIDITNEQHHGVDDGFNLHPGINKFIPGKDIGQSVFLYPNGYKTRIDLNNFVNAIVQYIDEEENEQKAIITIDENGVVHVKPFSGSEPCDCPTIPESEKKETDSGSISSVTKDPLEQLAEQIQKVLTELSTPQ